MSSRLSTASKLPQTRLDAVESREDIDAPERHVACAHAPTRLLGSKEGGFDPEPPDRRDEGDIRLGGVTGDDVEGHRTKRWE